MTLKTPEKLTAILDTLASGQVVYSDAARVNGVGVNTFWHWMRASQLDRDPDLFVAYLGERMPFHIAVEAAREIALHDARARIEKRSLVYQGEPTFFRDIPEFEAVAEPEAPRVAVPDDIDLDDFLGPEPVAEAVPDEPTPPVIPDSPAVIPDEPAPTVIPDEPQVIPDNREAPRVALVDAAPKKLSPLQEDLLARLAALRSKNASRATDGSGGTETAPAGSKMASGAVR